LHTEQKLSLGDCAGNPQPPDLLLEIAIGFLPGTFYLQSTQNLKKKKKLLLLFTIRLL
jgi:hypothetical protein